MHFLPLLLVLNFSVLGLGYLLGSLAGLFVLLGLCLVALVGVIVVAAFSQAPSTSRTLHRAFGIDTTFLSTLGK
jgi:hypothetical protein